MIGIYKITSPSGKIYIGQSINIEKRFKQYKSLSNSRNQVALHNSFKKYGFENHNFEIIEECNIELLNERERYYQDFYDVLKNGLNSKITTTNSKSGKLSNQTILKMSNSIKGKMSKENREKLSIMSKGNNYRGNLILDLNNGVFYYSIKEYATINNLNRLNVLRALKGITKNKKFNNLKLI